MTCTRIVVGGISGGVLVGKVGALVSGGKVPGSLGGGISALGTRQHNPPIVKSSGAICISFNLLMQFDGIVSALC